MSFASLRKEYRRSNGPLAISFRDSILWPSYPERATHLLHPYPAKLLAHIPFFFLSQPELASPGCVVADPFCGSGTVLLESALRGFVSIGADMNPLARLISGVKTRVIPLSNVDSGIRRIVRRVTSGSKASPVDGFLEFWYSKAHLEQLSALYQSISREQDADVRDYALLCFSAVARRLSRADPRVSVPVRLRRDQYPPSHPFRRLVRRRLKQLQTVDAVSDFLSVEESNRIRLQHFVELVGGDQPSVTVGTDARCLAASSGSVDLVISSPPYAGAQKYVRASSLSLRWMGFTTQTQMQELHSKSIGREHYARADYSEFQKTGVGSADRLLRRVRKKNPLRAHLGSQYVCEMRESILEIRRVLVGGGHFVLVIGNNLFSGLEFNSCQYLSELCFEAGFELQLSLRDTIRSRGLMTKRNKTAGVIEAEHVLVWRKAT